MYKRLDEKKKIGSFDHDYSWNKRKRSRGPTVPLTGPRGGICTFIEHVSTAVGGICQKVEQLTKLGRPVTVKRLCCS